MKDKTSYLKLIQECMSVDEIVQKCTPNDRLDYSVGVFLRQELSAITLYCIFEPVSRPDIFGAENSINDFQSGFVISRSMYETVLMSNYILLGEQIQHYKNALLMVARLQALRERIRFAQNMKSQNPRAKLFEEQSKKLKEEIIAHSEFSSLPSISREYVKESGKQHWKWHEYGMEDLARFAGFHKTWHTQYYGFLSNYSHANPLSIEQVESVRSPRQAEDMASILPDYGENFLSRSLDIHVRVCQDQGIDIEMPANSKKCVDMWKELNSKEMELAFQF